jgi:poly(3-hydroxybutyrate) depolymerase
MDALFYGDDGELLARLRYNRRRTAPALRIIMDMISYHILELSQLALAPARLFFDLTRITFKNPANPLAHTPVGRGLADFSDLFGRMTRRRGKPAFGFETTIVDGNEVEVREEIVWERPFCRLLHFRRGLAPTLKPQPRLLIVAPMSGHFATLLRGTVETFLMTHDVFITDWADARFVPRAAGPFDLDDYIDYVIEMCEGLVRAGGAPLHLLAVCQPSVPVLAAVARMEAEENPYVPASMTLIGGPIDTRRRPTAVNRFAKRHDLEWFRKQCIHAVPFPYPGRGRAVYPGFLQLSGFLAMNFDRHLRACVEMFNHFVQDDAAAAKRRRFYDEYFAVMDLTAEFYLQTIDTVFIRHALPKGEMTHRDRKVDPATIRRVGLMTIEGGKDDISGIGQTAAAHEICAGIPAALRARHLQKDVGHYGMFSGSRFRAEIAPRICAFHARLDRVATQQRRPAYFTAMRNLPPVRRERRPIDCSSPGRYGGRGKPDETPVRSRA